MPFLVFRKRGGFRWISLFGFFLLPFRCVLLRRGTLGLGFPACRVLCPWLREARRPEECLRANSIIFRTGIPLEGAEFNGAWGTGTPLVSDPIAIVVYDIAQFKSRLIVQRACAPKTRDAGLGRK